MFVTGPSESGKSGAVNYLKNNNSDIKHLKIRNVFQEIYKDSSSSLEYKEWYENESLNNFERFWINYIAKVNELSVGYPIVVMDTMYGLKEIKFLYKLLKDDLVVLYIDADKDKRVQREYIRLRTDSIYSDRKADLTITIKDILKKTNEKDTKKARLETFEYKNLRYTKSGIDFCEYGELFSYVVDNNYSLEQLYRNLDTFAESIRKKNKGKELVKK